MAGPTSRHVAEKATATIEFELYRILKSFLLCQNPNIHFMFGQRMSRPSIRPLVVVSATENLFPRRAEVDRVLVLSSVGPFLIDQWRICVQDAHLAQILQCHQIPTSDHVYVISMGECAARVCGCEIGKKGTLRTH